MNLLSAGSDSGIGRTVVVGVKTDQKSRELLTWALVKVADPGDTVIALHVLGSDGTVDREGRSSFLSLVRAFDSVLEAFEGFCNLKQVDLKLKICRGPSVRKILVREARSYPAAKVIVGSSKKLHPMSPTSSVAKYCAKKLPKDCWVLSVNNGKVVFQREGSPRASTLSQGIHDYHRPNSLLNVFNRSLSRNSKILNHSDFPIDDETSAKSLVKANETSGEAVILQKCSVCASTGLLLGSSNRRACDKAFTDCREDENPLAIVAVETDKSPEQQLGWPLRRHSALGEQKAPYSSTREMSVVQWVMRLPTRSSQLPAINLDCIQKSSTKSEVRSLNLDEKSGAFVIVNDEVGIAPTSGESPSHLPRELEGLHEKHSATCRLFKYNELSAATSDFTTENLIGLGGSSRVYKGCLPDGKELAVKMLKPSEDVLKGFVLEIEIITTLHHKNIVSLLGFCYEDNRLLLVYDFLSRGSLEDNLHGTQENLSAFGWPERFRVALGVAEALAYLHDRKDQPIIHRDVKSSNILLSDDFEPQLCDFGLAKWASSSSTYITCTDVAGTFGYLAPEYFMYGKVNDKVDVFAFGVVLLELLSGRKPISTENPKGQESVVMWATPILDSGKVVELLDPSLGSNYHEDQMERMVLAAMLCVRRTPKARPQMSQVVKLLQGNRSVTEWARQQVHSPDQTDSLLDEDISPHSLNIQSHLNLAFRDVEYDSLSMSVIEPSISLEEYLKGRWSHSSSFD
ncbi:hypothetical protein MLD38_013053 [Melastoma candidum]|uniref:Uncharacterized protein n=1 Tax=Melastoma candidum TaxID=119954 RepID=A0ACB9R8F9_9MYRT|nr:hypothetical protein MLD38_013053 [Melastoma candidum]